MCGETGETQPICAIATAHIQDCTYLAKARLSKDIINKSRELNVERQQQFLTGRILLAELLFQTIGIAELPEIITSDNGRPSFSQPELPDFNISHSGDLIIVALAQHCQVGIDLEIKRPRKKLLDLAKYSFSELEFSWLSSFTEKKREQAFWQLWTIRESILKLSGKGVWQMKEIGVNPHNHQLLAGFSPQLHCWSYQHDPLFWAITTNIAVTPNNISLWQAPPDLTLLVSQPLPKLTQFSTN